jgi:hypothetical protein
MTWLNQPRPFRRHADRGDRARVGLQESFSTPSLKITPPRGMCDSITSDVAHEPDAMSWLLGCGVARLLSN